MAKHHAVVRQECVLILRNKDHASRHCLAIKSAATTTAVLAASHSCRGWLRAVRSFLPVVNFALLHPVRPPACERVQAGVTKNISGLKGYLTKGKAAAV